MARLDTSEVWDVDNTELVLRLSTKVEVEPHEAKVVLEPDSVLEIRLSDEDEVASHELEWTSKLELALSLLVKPELILAKDVDVDVS